MSRAGVCAAIVIAFACGGQVSGPYNGAKVGRPCTPAVENQTTFLGFEQSEVSIELPSPDADPSLMVCLIDHFRGRVTCPYGGTSCTTPSGDVVTGTVEPQCADRRAANVVTFSCRCANALGKTDDGASYCSCPDGTTCEQLVAPIGPTKGPEISGAYCIPSGTSFDAFSSCLQPCDPNVTTCP